MISQYVKKQLYNGDLLIHVCKVVNMCSTFVRITSRQPLQKQEIYSKDGGVVVGDFVEACCLFQSEIDKIHHLVKL